MNKILNDYKLKMKVIEFATDFYDSEKIIIEKRIKRIEDKIAEIIMLEEIAENEDVKKLLKKEKENSMDLIRQIKRYCDIMRYDKEYFLKLILERFNSKDWYKGDMEILRRHIWEYS